MLNTDDTVLLIIDVQDKLVNMLKNSEEIAKNNNILAKTASVLGVPTVVTEQYPKGLGNTISVVREHIKEGAKWTKQLN